MKPFISSQDIMVAEIVLVIVVLLGWLSCVYLMIRWWMPPNRRSTKSLWCRLIVWGWTLVIQGWLLQIVAQSVPRETAAITEAIGMIAFEAGPVLWFVTAFWLLVQADIT